MKQIKLYEYCVTQWLSKKNFEYIQHLLQWKDWTQSIHLWAFSQVKCPHLFRMCQGSHLGWTKLNFKVMS